MMLGLKGLNNWVHEPANCQPGQPSKKMEMTLQ